METFHSSFLLWYEIWRSLFLNLICPALISVILKWSLGLQKLFVSCCFLMAPWILSFSIFKSWWVFRWWSKVNSFQLQARCTKNWCIIFFVVYIFSWKQTTSVLPPPLFWVDDFPLFHKWFYRGTLYTHSSQWCFFCINCHHDNLSTGGCDPSTKVGSQYGTPISSWRRQP